MVRLIAALLLFLLLLPAAWAQVLDSDKDNVPDTQELIDGTNPEDPGSNLLEVRVDGAWLVGNTVEISLEHPFLGRVKDVDFTFSFSGGSEPRNSGSSGVVQFTIYNAGRHQLEVKKGAFSSSLEFYPECVVIMPVVAELSDTIFFLALFVSLVIGALSYEGFRRLLLATEADYPLKKHPVVVPAYIGISAVIIMAWLYFALGRLFGMVALFLCLAVLIIVMWAFKAKGLLKAIPQKILPRKTGKAVKSLAFFPLLIAAVTERLKGKKKGTESEKHTKLNEMMDLKRDISESISRIEEAKKRSAEATGRTVKQEAMDELREEIGSFNQYLKRMLGLRKKKKDVRKVERKKSLAELRKEKHVKIMTEDLLEQMAREMDVLELPEGKAEEEKKKPGRHVDIKKKLIAIFIGGKKTPKGEPNIEIALSDEFGNPLPAQGAEFFVGGKKETPVSVQNNVASFKLKEGEYQLFIRLLGFIDGFLEFEAGKEKHSFKASLAAGLKFKITDEKGTALKDAFVNIVDENGKKVEDALQSIIWRSPNPPNAPAGVVAIPLDPKKLSFKSFKAKVVKAGYPMKEVIIPTSRISTQKALEKEVTLEKIKK